MNGLEALDEANPSVISDFSEEIVTSTEFDHRVYEVSICFLFGKSFRFDFSKSFDSIRSSILSIRRKTSLGEESVVKSLI